MIISPLPSSTTSPVNAFSPAAAVRELLNDPTLNESLPDVRAEPLLSNTGPSTPAVSGNRQSLLPNAAERFLDPATSLFAGFSANGAAGAGQLPDFLPASTDDAASALVLPADAAIAEARPSGTNAPLPASTLDNLPIAIADEADTRPLTPLISSTALQSEIRLQQNQLLQAALAPEPSAQDALSQLQEDVSRLAQIAREQTNGSPANQPALPANRQDGQNTVQQAALALAREQEQLLADDQTRDEVLDRLLRNNQLLDLPSVRDRNADQVNQRFPTTALDSSALAAPVDSTGGRAVNPGTESTQLDRGSRPESVPSRQGQPAIDRSPSLGLIEPFMLYNAPTAIPYPMQTGLPPDETTLSDIVIQAVDPTPDSLQDAPSRQFLRSEPGSYSVRGTLIEVSGEPLLTTSGHVDERA